MFVFLSASFFLLGGESPFAAALGLPRPPRSHLEKPSLTPRFELLLRRGIRPNPPPVRHRLGLVLHSSPSDNGESDKSTERGVVEEDMNPLTRASWYAVEAFGKVFANKEERSSDAMSQSTSAVDLTRSPESLQEALRRIELDNERSYFLSGEVDKLAYDEQCIFADPFVSFKGRDRFVENLSNLGSFITEYDARMLGYDVGDDGKTVKTKVMVKLELNLPWKPILAWPWGVTYKIDPVTCLITSHEESWDIDPWEGVKQIFRRPTVRITQAAVKKKT